MRAYVYCSWLGCFWIFSFHSRLWRVWISTVTCKPPLWFWCQFSRSSWTYCWLALARSMDYCGRLVTSTLPLCKFWGLPLLVLPLRGVESVLVWRGGTTSRKPTEKLHRTGSRPEENNGKSRKSLFNFKPGKVKKFEFHNIFGKCNLVCCDRWNSNALSYLYMQIFKNLHLLRGRNYDEHSIYQKRFVVACMETIFYMLLLMTIIVLLIPEVLWLYLTTILVYEV